MEYDLRGKTILIAPIDWGLGHSTRCVPIIRSLSAFNKVIIGVTDLNSDYFERHFPDLPRIELPSYRVTYSHSLPAWLSVLMQWPRLRSVIKEEHKILRKILSQYPVNLVISDNRFGLHHPSTHNIFITHQLNIQTLFPTLADSINRCYISRFDEVWVPDYAEEKDRLSGKLSASEKCPAAVKYIGPLSALSNAISDVQNNGGILAVLSGPEPQRTLLEQLILTKLAGSEREVMVIRGTRQSLDRPAQSKATTIDIAEGELLRTLIGNAGTVIIRSGYSSLMDMHLLGKKNLVLIPTPGQPEQEYLAAHWNYTFGTMTITQKDLARMTPEQFQNSLIP